jgi:hypothetical protein
VSLMDTYFFLPFQGRDMFPLVACFVYFVTSFLACIFVVDSQKDKDQLFCLWTVRVQNTNWNVDAWLQCASVIVLSKWCLDHRVDELIDE